MSEARNAAELINRLVTEGRHGGPGIKVGSLRVFGDWFGRPYDAWHTSVSAEALGSVLVVQFDQQETLTVSEPNGVSISSSEFLIQSATRARWQWFYYGRPHTSDNRYVEEHWIENGVVKASTTADWYPPDFSPSLRQPAAELL